MDYSKNWILINNYRLFYFLASSEKENLSSSGTLILNVGGTINQVKWETIDKFPKSRLQKLRYATCDGQENNFMNLF